MSWFLNIVGTPAACKAALQKDTVLSPKLKDALSEICDDKLWSGSNPPARDGKVEVDRAEISRQPLRQGAEDGGGDHHARLILEVHCLQKWEAVL
jgi:hypothetical protein